MNVPDGHSVQFSSATPLNVPAGQVAHFPELMPLIVPAGQGAQRTDLFRLYLPLGQSMHIDDETPLISLEGSQCSGRMIRCCIGQLHKFHKQQHLHWHICQQDIFHRLDLAAP